MELATPEELAKQVRDGRITFIVGSAVSIGSPSCLPSATRVTEIVLSALSRHVPGASEAVTQVEAIQFEGLFSCLFKGLGRNAALDAMALFAPEMYGEAGVPNGLHRALARYAIDASKPLLTTNYDRLIETSIYPALATWCSSAGYHDFSRMQVSGPVPGVLKMHGDALRAATVVLAIEQTSRLVRPELRTAIDHALRQSVICAVGYSGLDIDIFPLLAAADWEAIYWIVEPRRLPELLQPDGDGSCATDPSSGRVRALAGLARTKGRALRVVPLDLFSESAAEVLPSLSLPVETDSRRSKRLSLAAEEWLAARWARVGATRCASTIGLCLAYCGLNSSALDFLKGHEDALGGVYSALGEAECLHALGRFKTMAKRFTFRSRDPDTVANRQGLLRVCLPGVLGESARMSMGHPPPLLFLLLMPYYAGSAICAVRNLRRCRLLAAALDTADSEGQWAAENVRLDAWTRDVSIVQRFLQFVPTRLRPLAQLVCGVDSQWLCEEWGRIREDALVMGSRDHYLNASRYMARVGPVEMDGCIGAAHLVTEYALLTRVTGMAIAELDAGGEAIGASEYGLAIERYRACARHAMQAGDALTAAKAWGAIAGCYVKGGHWLRATCACRRAARLYREIEGFGHFALAAWVALKGRACVLVHCARFRRWGRLHGS